MEGQSQRLFSHISRSPNTHRSSDNPLQRSANKKWPGLFWAILKVLCLFHHRRVVTSRKCYICKVESRVAPLDLMPGADSGRNAGSEDVSLDQLTLAYGAKELEGVEEEETPRFINRMSVTQSRDDVCEACRAHWWNSCGIPVVYTEREIGVSHWNHRGSSLLSIILLLFQLAALGYVGGIPFYTMWGRPDQILHLLMRAMLIVLFAIYPILAVFTKIVGFRSGLSANFAGATVLNVRYLIKRGQFLDLPTKGLPGKPFLLICSLSPIVVMGYRMYVYINFERCEPSASVFLVASTIIGVIFFEIWCLFVYMLHLVRASFRRQFTLSLAHLKKYEGELSKCKGALFDTALDFTCFRQFVESFTALMFPLGVCAVITNMTWNYLLGWNNCIWTQDHALTTEIYLAILYWSEIFVILSLYLVAIGGFRVGYMWEGFLFNLLRFRASGTCSEFWREITEDMMHFSEGSKVMLASVVFSVIGIFAGIELSDQSIVFLDATCNPYNTTMVCI